MFTFNIVRSHVCSSYYHFFFIKIYLAKKPNIETCNIHSSLETKHMLTTVSAGLCVCVCNNRQQQPTSLHEAQTQRNPTQWRHAHRVLLQWLRPVDRRPAPTSPPPPTPPPTAQPHSLSQRQRVQSHQLPLGVLAWPPVQPSQQCSLRHAGRSPQANASMQCKAS